MVRRRNHVYDDEEIFLPHLTVYETSDFEDTGLLDQYGDPLVSNKIRQPIGFHQDNGHEH